MPNILNFSQFLFESEEIYSTPGDPYQYKISNGIWMAKGPKLKNWTSLENNATANDILDKRYPGLRKSSGKFVAQSKKETNFKTQNKSQTNFIDGGGMDPEKNDPALSKRYNIHLIPDKLSLTKPNYRSAQMPIEIMKNFIQKYGIRNVIRFNGDGADGRHTKSDQSTSIQAEKNLCSSLGVNFQKLSSTKDQDKVNKTLLSGNTLIHCAHGADRTGGNVGGYLYSTRVNPNLDSTDEIWRYTTKYNGWNNMVRKNPNAFSSGGYLQQAQKFGVKDINQARTLAGS